MAAFSEILEHYLSAVQFMSGAKCVSLYVPDPIGNASRAILVHTEESPRVPELVDLASAREFSANYANSASAPDKTSDILGKLRQTSDKHPYRTITAYETRTGWSTPQTKKLN